jgi:hypothetical protein
MSGRMKPAVAHHTWWRLWCRDVLHFQCTGFIKGKQVIRNIKTVSKLSAYYCWHLGPCCSQHRSRVISLETIWGPELSSLASQTKRKGPCLQRRCQVPCPAVWTLPPGQFRPYLTCCGPCHTVQEVIVRSPWKWDAGLVCLSSSLGLYLRWGICTVNSCWATLNFILNPLGLGNFCMLVLEHTFCSAICFVVNRLINITLMFEWQVCV